MGKILFKQDDFFITLDPADVVKVTTYDSSYILSLKDGNACHISKKYKTVVGQIMSLMEEHFEKPPTKTSLSIVYKIAVSVTNRFVLCFPNLDTYIYALRRFNEELFKKYGVQILIDENVKGLEFGVHFPKFYDSYAENKALIVSLLGEPQTKD